MNDLPTLPILHTRFQDSLLLVWVEPQGYTEGYTEGYAEDSLLFVWVEPQYHTEI